MLSHTFSREISLLQEGMCVLKIRKNYCSFWFVCPQLKSSLPPNISLHPTENSLFREKKPMNKMTNIFLAWKSSVHSNFVLGAINFTLGIEILSYSYYLSYSLVVGGSVISMQKKKKVEQPLLALVICRIIYHVGFLNKVYFKIFCC